MLEVGGDIWFPVQWERGTVEAIIAEGDDITTVLIRKADGTQIALDYADGETVTVQ
jgi:hypothetical protein